MIIQNNPAPWVLLAFVVLLGCLLAGMLLGDVGPFNTETAAARMQITQTQASINASTTQFAIQATQTQQAPLVQQTLFVVEATTVVMQQTATSGARSSMMEVAQANSTHTALAVLAENARLLAQATQTAISNDLMLQSLASKATATSVVQKQKYQNANADLIILIIILALLLMSAWIIISAITRVHFTYTQRQIAEARLLAEQRRLTILRANLQKLKDKTFQKYPIPTSLMKHDDTNDELPRAE